MNTIRRTAVLLGLIAAIVVGSSVSASAAFTDRTTARSASLQTATVAAPTGLSISVGCVGTELRATVRWTKSNSPRISGYVISGNMNGTALTFRAGAGDTSYTHVMPSVGYAVSVPVSVTVTTDTEYRWTKASAPLNTPVTTC